MLMLKLTEVVMVDTDAVMVDMAATDAVMVDTAATDADTEAMVDTAVKLTLNRLLAPCP